jgi:UDP-N-acetylglucosamine--N-acetylmuramyl-(pentapeptide) pyrophosphoryl-undecaprenol N-acetylglucosamine transferase
VSAAAASPTILLAGGGSGGHISPGLAVAERLAETDPPVDVVFVCSERAIDARMLGRAAARFVTLPARPATRRPRALLAFVRAYRRSVRRARAVIADHGVTHVLALGGFVAAPAAAAGRAAGVPVTLLNLDDPPGRANRLIARRCDHVWSAVPLRTAPGFAERVTGLPIRRCALAPGSGRPADRAACRARLGLDPDRPTLLVTGASQGASTLNALVPTLVRTDPETFAGWQVHHLSGADGEARVRAAYAGTGVPVVVAPFLDEIGLAWGAADLAVSRAGANSVAETHANAVPTLFLPYPHHRDQHQRHNAQPLVDLDAAVMVEDRVDAEANAASVGPVLRTLMTDGERRETMRRRLRAHPPPDAARAVATMLLENKH